MPWHLLTPADDHGNGNDWNDLAGAAANSEISNLHGSHTFSEMKFKDFSMTFHGQNYIFQALRNRYLAYCRCVILW